MSKVTMDRPVRFGILGTGRITRRLVADLQSTPHVTVTAIASRSGERARWSARQYGIATAVTDYAPLIARDDVDAVYVALPPSLHARWSIAAAERGKHVLCEKPLATTAAEVESIAAAARHGGVRWLDATGWLHHERTAAFQSLLQTQRFGQLRHISAAVSFDRPFQSGDHRLDPDLGGGCLLDLGWYAAGLVRFAAGSMPQSVLADTLIHRGIVERVTAMMWFDDSLRATISCGYDTATRKWFEIAGSDASLICDDFTRPWPDRAARCWIHDAAGSVEENSFDGHQERSMIETLVGTAPLADLQQQAIDTQRILDALAESGRAGERVAVKK